MPMIKTNNVIILVITMMMMMKIAKMSNGATYKVGGFPGWTSIGNVDYNKWAASNNFQVGDTIIFKYNPQYHNVMRVPYKIYNSCNISEGTPLETFNTGNDSVKLNSYGHNLFICGFPGHCQKGQKVDINVIRVTATQSPASSSSHDDDQCPYCSNKASPFMASFALIGLAMSLFALSAF